MISNQVLVKTFEPVFHFPSLFLQTQTRLNLNFGDCVNFLEVREAHVMQRIHVVFHQPFFFSMLPGVP